MAYTLGFFCADGSMFVNPRGSRYVAFYSNDRNVLEFIRRAIGAAHKISVKQVGKFGRKSPAYFLQIGSKEMFIDLSRMGIMINKSKRMVLPDIPEDCFSPFVRGYFDGDGNVVYGLYKRKARPHPARILRVSFTSGSRGFLKSLSERLFSTLQIEGVLSYYGRAWRLVYSNRPSLHLLEFMYAPRLDQLPVLQRKFERFIKAKKYM